MGTAVTKVFSFDAAHQLPNHDGKCARLHGHTYKVELTIEGPVQALTGKSDEGMVLDFSSLSEAFRRYIDTAVDHRFMVPTLNKSVTVQHDKIGDKPSVRVAIGKGSQYHLLRESVALLAIGNTTAECLAEWIWRTLADAFQASKLEVYITGVRVWETPTGFAEYRP